ncbi:MAG: hypothetical protein MI864_10350, partial [Pseudomonadales bacterium]|nr:hypothetical protein [Pseudomonadales bacterium]
MKARIGSALLIVFFGVTGTYLVLSSTHSSKNNLQADIPSVWPPEASTLDRDSLSALPAETRPEPTSNPTPDQLLAGAGVALPDSLRGTDIDGGFKI